MDAAVYEFLGITSCFELKSVGSSTAWELQITFGLQESSVIVEIFKRDGLPIYCWILYFFAVSWVGICFSQGVVHVSLLQVVSDKVRRVRLTRMVHLIVNIVRRFSCILLCLTKLSSSLLHVVLHYHPIVAELPKGFHVIFLIPCIVK